MPEPDPASPSGRVQISSNVARMPEVARAGVLSTGAILLGAGGETVVDFVQSFDGRSQIVSRVVLPNRILNQLASLLERSTPESPEDKTDSPVAKTARPKTLPATPSVPTIQPTKLKNLAEEGGDRDGNKVKDSRVEDNDLGNDTSHRTEDNEAPEKQPTPSPKRSPKLDTSKIDDLYQGLLVPDGMLAGVFANKILLRNAGSEIVLDFIAQFYPSPTVSARVIFATGRIPALISAIRQHQANQKPPKPDQHGEG